MTTDDTDQFRILIVCTGNICRSPAAQLLLAREIGPSVHVESAGTGALVGSAVEPTMSALLQADGISTEGFTARALTAGMVSSAELVLTATRQHRAAVVDTVPAAVRRTFTLREYAHILAISDIPSAGQRSADKRLRETLESVAMARSQVTISANDLDIPDPFGRSQVAFEEAWERIRQAVQAIVFSSTEGRFL